VSGTGPGHLVRRFYHEVWNCADEAVAYAILHRDLSFRASLGPESKGPDGFIGYMRSVHAALGNYTCVIDDLIETADRAAARMTFSGLHRGRFFDVPATGQRITWSGAAFFTVADSQLRTIWVLGDIDAVKRQLGATGNSGMA
jgi:predicted ester cyclase